MIILVQILVKDRLPLKSGSYHTSNGINHFNVKTGRFTHNRHAINPETWFKATDLESLFPDNDLSYNVADSASQGRIAGITMHQEGQNFFKNHILRQLKK
jgi:hypothetical protein